MRISDGQNVPQKHSFAIVFGLYTTTARPEGRAVFFLIYRIMAVFVTSGFLLALVGGRFFYQVR